MKKIFLFAATMLLAVSVASATQSAEASNEVVDAVKTEAAALAPKVFSNCYDGYLNVRMAPSTQAKIVGKLKNGPEGAELLGVEGTWSKVRVNGVVGYVASKYLQSTPTEAVYVDASAFIGQWARVHMNGGTSYTINSNGKFTMESTTGVTRSGTWYLAGYNLILKYSNGAKSTCSIMDEYNLDIDGYAYYDCD